MTIQTNPSHSSPPFVLDGPRSHVAIRWSFVWSWRIRLGCKVPWGGYLKVKIDGTVTKKVGGCEGSL